MDVTPPTNTPTKRPRTKVVAKEPTAAPKSARKTLATSRKKSAGAGEKSKGAAVVSVETTAVSSVDMHAMIATAAFYLAAERSFAPGHELDDWLEAERRIKAGQPA